MNTGDANPFLNGIGTGFIIWAVMINIMFYFCPRNGVKTNLCCFSKKNFFFCVCKATPVITSCTFP